MLSDPEIRSIAEPPWKRYGDGSPGDKMKRAASILFVALALLLLAMNLKGALLSLPQAPAHVPAGSFDTGRAMARLQRILGDQRPHPVDSDSNDAVRERLLTELRAMGLQPTVTDDFTCNGGVKTRTISCARIRNVLATIGPAAGRHVLLVSHYDSTPAGPGASDDGIGVASMLETAFLLSRQPLKRPVTFLFDEGEEAGLIGARAFLERNPLAARVDTLINLESRGVTGPAIMFETSRPNGAAIAALRRSARGLVANSATTDFYKLIPNSTDVAVLAERKDWTILNFAVIGNETRYHSPGDTMAALDPRSVAHMGQQTLALTRTLAEASPLAHGDRLYADVAGRFLISLPDRPEIWIAVIILFFLVNRRRAVASRRPWAAIAAAIIGSTAFVFLAQAALGLVRPGAWWRAHPEAAGAAVYATAIAVSLFALAWLGRRIARDHLRTAFWSVFLILGIVLRWVAPGSSIFFVFPPLVAIAGMALERRLPGSEAVAAWLAWALLFLTLAPLLDLTEVLLDFDSAWIFAPLAAIILLPALIELKPLAARLPPRALGITLAILLVLGWLPAAFAPAYSPDRKQEFGIEYAWQATDRDARWMVLHDGAPLPAAFQALGRFEHGVAAPWSTRKRWAVEAPLIPIEPPALDQLARTSNGSVRTVTLRLRTNGAETVRLRFAPEARLAGVTAGGWARLFGAGKPDEDYVFRCHGRSCDGLVFDIAIGAPQKMEALLMGVRSGLPPAAAPLVAARPANAAPQYNADSTIATRRVGF
jgi:hypothetical protein